MATRLQKGVATTVGLSGLALLVALVGNPFGGPFGSNGGGGGASASGSATTFTSTQSDGGAAFVAPIGQRVCLNGAGCTQYVQSDGGSSGLVGLKVDMPSGLVLDTPATTLDFPNLAAHDVATLTILMPGITVTDVPLCRTVGATGLTTDIDVHEYVQDAGVVALVAHNDGSGNVDPPPTAFKCVGFR